MKPDYTPSDILRHFDHTRHPEGSLAREVFAAFSDVAYDLDALLPNSAEKSVALRHLLEGKDAAVRAAYDVMEADNG